MIRFFNAVTAISTTAIAIGFGLMSQENERTQNKAALEALYSSQTAAALHFCSNHGLTIAAETIEDLIDLENDRGLLPAVLRGESDGEAVTDVEATVYGGSDAASGPVYEPGSIQERLSLRLIDFQTDFDRKCGARTAQDIDEAILADLGEIPLANETSSDQPVGIIDTGPSRGLGSGSDDGEDPVGPRSPVSTSPDMDTAPVVQAPLKSADTYSNAIRNSDNTDLRISQRDEAVTAKKLGTDTERARRFHAVLASYKVDREEAFAVDRLALLQRQIARWGGDRDLSVRIYRTQISNHHAIVLASGDFTSAAARDLVTLAKTQDWAFDAFMQGENTWTDCGQPETVEALKACG